MDEDVDESGLWLPHKLTAKRDLEWAEAESGRG
jgi:hypothetical protein